MKWERADNMGDIIKLYENINYINNIPIISIFNSYDLGFMSIIKSIITIINFINWSTVIRN